MGIVMWCLLAHFVTLLRNPVYASLLIVALVDLVVGYNLIERFVYLLPMNAPEEFSFDFFVRVFTEPPQGHLKPFTVSPAMQAGQGIGGLEYGTTRNERRGKK